MTISRQFSDLSKKLTLLFAVIVLQSCSNLAPRQFAGVIVDSSMNTVTIRVLDSGETATFSTFNADKTEGHGMLIGAPVRVDYEGSLQQSPIATKVITDATYTRAVGIWTRPDPIAPGKKMGIEIMVEGKAVSINMASLVYSSWALQGDANRITLHGKSLGNRQSLDITDKARIWEKNGKMYLSIEGTDFVYEKASR